MIAIIYEGVKIEPIILKNIIRNFFSNEVVDIPIGAAYGGNIHDLANILKNGEELDIISVVKEKIKRSASKSKYKDFIDKSRDDFSEIYLFFDCDPQHMYNGNIDKNGCLDNNLNDIKTMFDIFNNETNNGKLYVNYPMVESLKDIQCPNDCCVRCFERIDNLTSYKSIVAKNSLFFQDIRKYDLKDWGYFSQHALCKANCLIYKEYKMPEPVKLKSFSQKSLLEKQREYILNQGKVYILSSFPLFLLEYFGVKCWGKGGLLCASKPKNYELKTNSHCQNK